MALTNDSEPYGDSGLDNDTHSWGPPPLVSREYVPRGAPRRHLLWLALLCFGVVGFGLAVVGGAL